MHGRMAGMQDEKDFGEKDFSERDFRIGTSG